MRVLPLKVYKETAMLTKTKKTAEQKAILSKQRSGLFKKTWILYVFLIPMILYLFVLSYLPMYGIQIAFRDYTALDGVWGSEWVGLGHFFTFFESYQFGTLLRNTLTISIYSIVAGFPMPIIFALILNYIGNMKFKKTAQLITYAPHFISTVVYCGMILIFLSNDGIVNQILMLMGVDPTKFLSTPEFFTHIYVWSGVIKGMGWGSIMYVSVLASVGPELHEAAIVDGANKFKRLLYIDLPSIMPTMIIMLIMRMGEVMDVGFEKAFLLQSSVNLDYSEIISTYVYKIGIQGGQFSYSAAIGLFNNIINFGLLIGINKLAKKTTKTSLW